jgi:hypothetical protein
VRPGAVGRKQVASILGFTDRPERWSACAPLQLKDDNDG